MNLDACILRLFTSNPFTISRGEKIYVDNVFVRLEENGIYGYGEASPNTFYHENADIVLSKILSCKDFLKTKNVTSIDDIHRYWNELFSFVSPSRAAQCALDIALWDLFAKKNNTSVIRLLWNHTPKPVISSCTIGICEPHEWQSRVETLRDFPCIKLKMDQKADLRFPTFIRSCTSASLRIDPNCSWEHINTTDLFQHAESLSVECIEQPLPPEKNERMKDLLKQTTIPLIADESCTTIESMPALFGLFTGINIKLSKCGGLTPGFEMIKTAQSMNLKVMIGCMLESNLLISAGLCLAQAADYADLDGNWLLKEKVFEGVEFTKGIITLQEGLGLGVIPTTDMF